MLGGAGSPGGDELLTVTVVRDEHGYGMKVSGDNPVYVQSVKEHGAAWRAGLRAGDRILRVDGVPVHHHTHQRVVMMIRANATAVLTVHQNTSRHKTPITAPLPVNPEKQRQLEVSKVHTMRLMLEQEQKYIRELRNELSKVPDVRKQAQLESSEQRCATLQHEIDTITAGQPIAEASPSTPRLSRTKTNLDKPAGSPPPTSFLSGLPRSLSNLTGQSLRNLRTRQNNKIQQENQPPLVRQNSDETNKRRHVHNNTVPMVPTTCLDNTPPPLPPRSIERPKRNPLSPNMTPVNPLAKPKPCSSVSPAHKYYKRDRGSPMHQSMPSYESQKLRMSSHSLDGELDGPQPNSIALQMSYPLVNVPPPPLQTDDRTGLPVLHVRSQSSPEHLDHGIGLPRSGGWTRGTPPPGTPPPPYAHNTQPCADPQRAIISMEEDEEVASETSNPGLFSNLRTVLDSKARTAVLLNWLLGERRCACATLLLLITDGYRTAQGVPTSTLRRWAYEIQSTFLAAAAVLRPPSIDPQAAVEVEDVLHDDYDKEEILRNVFRKARQKAKEEMAQQLNEFQVKRQVGLGGLYGPDDAQIERCVVDKAQEQVIVERLLVQCLSGVANAGTGAAAAAAGGCGARAEGRAALLAALQAAALHLQCRPAAVAAAAGGARAGFLQRDKLYKQRLKQLAKMNPQPFIVRGHHLQLQALTSEAHCHYCDQVIWGLAPQAYFCADCKLRVHRNCAKSVEEACCIDGEHHNNRISRLIDLIHPVHPVQDDKKSRKSSSNAFLNMERTVRKLEDEQPWDQTLTPQSTQERRDESDESLYESADCHSDAISASDDAIPRLSKSPTMSKESLKLAITDEEVDCAKIKKGHRKTMSLSNPLEIVKNLGDDWFDHKKDLDKNSDKKKSRESLWSEEEKDSVHGSTTKLEQVRKNSKKEDKSNCSSRKSSTTDAPKTRKSSKGSSVSSFFLRRKKTPTTVKPVEAVAEAIDRIISTSEILNYTRTFLEEEKRYASLNSQVIKLSEDTDTDDEPPTPKLTGEHRRRLSRQTSRSKSKVRGKSQSVKVNTLRKSHSGTLKKAKKKSIKTPLAGRSRQASVVESTPIVKKKLDVNKANSWFYSGHRGESKRDGSSEEPAAPEPEADATEAASKEPAKDTNLRAAASGGRGVNRAESCRERDPPRRGKHRNASDPNRLTAHNNHDLEGGAPTAPSGSSSSSSLSSRSNESTTVPVDQQASQSDWSEEEDPLAPQWADSLPPQTLDSLVLSARLRKRQEVIHELIVSEGSHVRWLKVLGVDFLRPLEKQPSLLPAEELRALFPDLPGVRERHMKLYADLRALRKDSINHIVQIRPVADAMLGTLGEPGYATCLSRFCRGQRLALETLRERRRKNKELHHFLSAREQLPRCGRLQLRDLLACVWQRLTKYQLLLEGILKTVCESDADSDEDIAQLKRAHDTAKDVLQRVDTAIRTAENDHRLRTIQNKLEVRAGSEWEELRRLDLTQRQLRMEGELAVRHDGNKKISVLALMLTDALVLLQREGDRFVLRPIPAPSQQAPLSPLLKWDKVLFRPNAAARNTFFLMNINGVQMHELSANTPAEYATWVKNIQDCPLAKLAEQKPSPAPHQHHQHHQHQHQHSASRSTDDGSNVSRNPSDASEKSAAASEERDRASAERERERAVSADREREKETEREREKEPEREREKEPEKKEEEKEKDKEEVVDREDKHVARRPTMSLVSTHEAPPPRALEPRAALTVSAPRARLAHTATRAFTPQEQLRRLDSVISRALAAKSAAVGELLGVPRGSLAQVADLAVAEALGQCGERLLYKSAAVGELLGVPRGSLAQVADLAVAEALGQCGERLLYKSAAVGELLGVPRGSLAQVADLAVAEALGQCGERLLYKSAAVGELLGVPRGSLAQVADLAVAEALGQCGERLLYKSAAVGELLGVPRGSLAQVADLAVAEALGQCGERLLYKSAAVGELLGVPRGSLAQVADLAVAEALGQCGERLLYKSAAVGELLGVPRGSLAQVADLAVAEALGQCGERLLYKSAAVGELLGVPRGSLAQVADLAVAEALGQCGERLLYKSAAVGELLGVPRGSLAQVADLAVAEALGQCGERLLYKSAAVGELLGVPRGSLAQVADLAVAEALGQCDTSGELRLQRSVSSEEPSEIHTLLLAALTQANQLTSSLTRALTVNEAASVAARAPLRGRCERCTRHPLQRSSTLRAPSGDHVEPPPPPSPPRSPSAEESRAGDSFSMLDTIASLEQEVSFDMLSELDPVEPSAEDALESNLSSASLALSLVPLHAGLQRALARLAGALPALEAARRDSRRELPALRDANDALRHAHTHYQPTEEISYPANNLDQSLQEQPSNGG